MSSNGVYIRERIEELRSRISLIKSTFSTIEQDYWVTFSNSMNNCICPNILYPSSTFIALSDIIKRIEMNLESFDLNYGLPLMLEQLDDLDQETLEILKELVRLQNVLSQRMSGIGIMKTLEYEPSSQFEFCIISKSFAAVDALSFELVERMLGEKWLKKEKYLPISLFDYSGYMINLYSYVISVPYPDSFRSRFWPSLAHEVGHIFTDHYSKRAGPILELSIEEADELTNLLGYTDEERDWGIETATDQIVELISDAVSVYVCPTSFISAATFIGIPFESPLATNGELADHFRYAEHPPLDSRLTLMQNILKFTKVLSVDIDFEEYTQFIRAFLEQKNIFGLTDKSYKFIEKYNDFAYRLSKKIFKILKNLNIKVFNEKEFKKVQHEFFNPNSYDLSPVQLLTLAWIKRLKCIKNDGLLEIHDYFDKRLKERKMFEHVINSMHKYYETEIVAKLEGLWHDLRNNPY